MSEKRPEDYDYGNIGFESDPCVICGRPAVRPWIEGVDAARGEEHKEPMACNRCLVDMRGDMATELEVRRQLGNLESQVGNQNTKIDGLSNKIDGYAWKQWILYFAFTLAFAVLAFLAGLWLGG